jgi:hypothetical protein
VKDAQMEEYVSPDGKLRLLVTTSVDGDMALGFAGFPWHIHSDILTATTGLPKSEAIRRFIGDLVSGESVVVLWSVGGVLQDVWVSDDPAHDADYAQVGESIELRHWDGRLWTSPTPGN